MGNTTTTTGDKPKFDLVTASKTKKYRIITAVVLVIGVLLLIGGLLMKGLNTTTVVANSLEINELSGLTKKNDNNIGGLYCDISVDQPFLINTGTVNGRALSEPITFSLMGGAEQFLMVCDASNTYQINKSYYPGMFYLTIRDDAPTFVYNEIGEAVNPTGKLRISCGSYVKEINFTYYPI